MHAYHDQPRRRTVVVGGGFSGTLTATRLLQFADTPMEICLLERDDGSRYGGIAFGETGTTWDHMLNIQAGRITFGRERPEDFLEWANEEADRTGWPQRWKYHVFGVSCVVPRRIYGQYLKERLHGAAADAQPGVELTLLHGEAIDLTPRGDGFVLKYTPADPEATAATLNADHVVLATGHLEPVYRPFYHRVQGSARFVADPYAAGARAVFDALDPDAPVLIVGSALSAFDTVVSLVGAGHRGQITIVSRGGHMHGTYPADHQHDIWSVRRPPFLDDETLTAGSVVAGVRAEYLHLRETAGVGCDEGVFAERVMKAWEPYVIELLQRLPPGDVRMLLAGAAPAVEPPGGTAPAGGSPGAHLPRCGGRRTWSARRRRRPPCGEPLLRGPDAPG
ncbi:FAD/NAD(P)-binding protein [Catenuloplanes japonicus]|uniref:FAD/NAD(P)-binding protein n=1 Tax=Catenuloplanes japonicus TaxID=33876 RepID=UPI000523F5C2|nr:FAD/NAD(P)-binding protein [Catenuloplanes japonicus]